MSLFDTWTESGRLLEDGYKRLTAVDYDPECEMVEVINEYDDLPDIESALASLMEARDNIINEYDKLEREYSTRYSELKERIASAEIVELLDIK